MNPLPQTVEALIEELEAIYPPRCIGRHDSLETAHRYAGASELVGELRLRLQHTIDQHRVAQELLPNVRR